MISHEEVSSIYKAVYMGATGNFDVEKYNFKSSPHTVKKPWISRFVTTPYDARVFSAAAVYHGKYWADLEEDESYALFREWRYYISKPEISAKKLAVSSLDDLSLYIKDSITGPRILNDVLGQRMHFVTFSYIMRTTKAYNSWNSMNWKLHRKKLELIDKTIDIDTSLVLSFASSLKEILTK